MEWLFGKRITPEEMLRKNQRALNKAMRDLDRERARMEQQEKKIIADIKKLAKDGQMDAVKIMAKDLVRTRRYVKKFMLMKANIQAVSLKIQTLRSQNTMTQAMKGVTKAMQNMNKQLNLPQIQKILQEFEKQSEIMDMKEEIMNDAIDDAMEDEGDEEESDAVVAQVLDELGLQLTDQLSGLPQASGSLSVAGSKQPVATAAGNEDGSNLADADADLQARLENHCSVNLSTRPSFGKAAMTCSNSRYRHTNVFASRRTLTRQNIPNFPIRKRKKPIYILRTWTRETCGVERKKRDNYERYEQSKI